MTGRGSRTSAFAPLAALAGALAGSLAPAAGCEPSPNRAAPGRAALALGGELALCAPDEVDLHVLPPPRTTEPLARAEAPPLCVDGDCLWQGSDDLYGAPVPRAQAWYVAGGFIFHGRERVAVRGVNWFGLETEDNALHGLWTGRSIGDFMDQMLALGFNAVRLPLSPWSIRPGTPTAAWATAATGATTGRELLDLVLAEAQRRELYVVLDLHTCDARARPRPGRVTGCAGYTTADWHSDLRVLAGLAKTHDHVLGIDLFNEPYDYPWAEWADVASEAARVVLDVCPTTLVLVQGSHDKTSGGGYDLIDGENLTLAGSYPLDAPPSRLVYAPHVYGPELFALNYTLAPEFPDNLPEVWDTHFGYLLGRGKGLVIGEFGGVLDDARVPRSVAWQLALIQYLQDRGIDSFFYWSWNPDSDDTAGLLLDDWETPNALKLRALEPLLSPSP